MIRFLLDPFNILWILLLATLFFLFRERWKTARWLGAATVAWLVLVSTPLLPNLLLDSLENRYEPIAVERLQDRDAPYNILVHGGGHGFDDRLPANSLLSDQAMKRLSEGIRLYHQLPESRLVLSGYSSSGRTTQAGMLRNTALLLGIEKERMVMNTGPANTYEEVKDYAEKFGNDYPLIVVTSAAHMPRAIYLFEKAGIEAIPSPAHFRLKGSQREVWFGLPSLGSIGKMKTALTEYAANVRARFYTF